MCKRTLNCMAYTIQATPSEYSFRTEKCVHDEFLAGFFFSRLDLSAPAIVVAAAVVIVFILSFVHFIIILFLKFTLSVRRFMSKLCTQW